MSLERIQGKDRRGAIEKPGGQVTLSLRRLLRGLASWVRRTLEIDPKAASYIIFGGPRRSLWTYLAPIISISSLTVAIIRSPVGAIVLVAGLGVLALAVIYSLGVMPRIRWHILNEDIILRFHEQTGQHTTHTNIIRLRCIVRGAERLTYPIQFIGSLTINRVSQDGLDLPEVASQDIHGYHVERNPGNWTVHVRLPRALAFGDETTFTIVFEQVGAYPPPWGDLYYTVRTLIDSLSLRVCFHRQAYPTEFAPVEVHGVSTSLDRSFVPQKIAEGADHICEQWRPQQLMYDRAYHFRWRWPALQTELGPAQRPGRV